MDLIRRAIRRDLTAFAATVPHTPLPEQHTWRALARRWSVLVEAMESWPVSPTERRLLDACSNSFHMLEGRAERDERAALAVRLIAARESICPPATDLSLDVPPGLLAWALLDQPDAVRRRVLRGVATRRRALAWLDGRRLERLGRQAFSHLADVPTPRSPAPGRVEPQKP